MIKRLAILFAVVICCGTASGQDVQVAFDSSHTVYVITTELNNEYQLITGFDGFVEARLFVGADSSFSLEVVTESGGQRSRVTRSMTRSDVDALRHRLTTVMADDVERTVYSGNAELDQSGRPSLLLGSTLWSLLYYGTAISMTFDANEPAIPYLITGGMGYLVPALLTNNAPVTDGAASLALGGMFQGTIHGWALAFLVSGDNLFNEDTPRLGFGLSVLTGVTETVAGYVVATKTKMSEGRAAVINTSAFYGMMCGGLLTVAAFDQIEPSSEVSARALGGISLAGAVAGVMVGNAVANGQHYSSGDATMYGICGFLGAALPWIAATTISMDDVNFSTVGLASAATTAAGLWLGDKLVRNKDYRATDGTISSISVLGGALLGLGCAMAIDNTSAMGALTYVGAVGGFGLSLAMAKPTTDAKSTSGLDINVNPLGPLMTYRDAYGITRPAPFVVARYRF